MKTKQQKLPLENTSSLGMEDVNEKDFQTASEDLNIVGMGPGENQYQTAYGRLVGYEEKEVAAFFRGNPQDAISRPETKRAYWILETSAGRIGVWTSTGLSKHLQPIWDRFKNAPEKPVIGIYFVEQVELSNGQTYNRFSVKIRKDFVNK